MIYEAEIGSTKIFIKLYWTQMFILVFRLQEMCVVYV